MTRIDTGPDREFWIPSFNKDKKISMIGFNRERNKKFQEMFNRQMRLNKKRKKRK